MFMIQNNVSTSVFSKGMRNVKLSLCSCLIEFAKENDTLKKIQICFWNVGSYVDDLV
jgi:hypothetical protein